MKNFFEWVISTIGAIIAVALAIGTVLITSSAGAVFAIVGTVVIVIGLVATAIKSYFDDSP